MNIQRISGLFLTMLFLIISTANGETGCTIDYSENAGGSKTIQFKLNDYQLEEVEKGSELYSRVVCDGGTFTNIKGYAELPFFQVTLQLPENANYTFNVSSKAYTDHSPDYELLPSRGTIYRNQDPESVPFEVSGKPWKTKWYPGDIVDTTSPFMFRHVKGKTLYIYPFQYNKKKNRLRAFDSITIEITEIPDQMMSGNSVVRTIAPPPLPVQSICNDLFINYSEPAFLSTQSYYEDELGDILVIYTNEYKTAIQPWINWKKEKGFTVLEQEVSAGTNVKSIVKSTYNDNPNLLYVQLVGDWDDIKSDMGTSQNAPMDPMLGCVSGNDYVQDIIIGRFSANSPNDVTVQVNKSIRYEKEPDLNGHWYKQGLGIGSEEGSGAGDDREADWEHIDIIKENKLLETTYSDVVEAYRYASASVVTNALNDGVSVINYCGHGSSTSFVTTGFSNSHVNSLSNGNKLPVIFSVACVNGQFHKSGDCFAETWLKKSNGGAVAALMSTINQPWTPPMRGQDYFNDILTGGYNYSVNPGSGTSTSEGRTTFGSVVLSGLVLMYAESSNSDDLETIQTWSIFGDSSLQLRTDTPGSVSLSNTSVQAGQPFATTINTTGDRENVLVSLSQNGQTFSGLTNASGSVTLNHSLSGGSATLVVSGFNLETVVETITIGGGDDPDPDDVAEISNGQQVTSISAAKNEWRFFKLTVPEGASDLSFVTSGGSGDTDLYVRFGSKPTLQDFDCRPYQGGNNETCDISDPQAGTYFIGLYGYSSFSSVTLMAHYSGGGDNGNGGDTELLNGQPVSDLSGSKGGWTYYTITVPQQTSDLSISTSGGSGDMDLYVRYGEKPTLETFDCRPYKNGNNESCDIDETRAGTYHIGLYGYSDYDSVTLTANYNDSGNGDGVTELVNGEAVSSVSCSKDSWIVFKLPVPENVSDLSITISGGNGDADLYVKHGGVPSLSSYDCRPYRSGNDETCTVDSPEQGNFYIALYGYESFSGVTVIAEY